MNADLCDLVCALVSMDLPVSYGEASSPHRLSFQHRYDLVGASPLQNLDLGGFHALGQI